MSSKHARLVAAVTDAMAAQGFTQKQVATMGGCTQGMLSQAINNGVTMKDERWKLICEGLGLDYDEIVADLPEERERFTLREETPAVKTEDRQAAPAENCGGGTEVPLSDAHATEDDEAARANRVLTSYLAGHLKEDVRKGMDIPLEDLYILLDTCKKMLHATEHQFAP